ncbi:MAG: hypothetical protein CMF62_00050 [Magnetococcales bacterium]|nr:hypothetical protein [Magnetococcales bacterium]|tara:strand:- start:4764 stop:6026 length:1263 start_codon:yes stop_codon:yes gene_type:complete
MDIDTNIQNYSINDIIDIFGLGNTYTENDIIQNYSILKYKTRNKPNLAEFFDTCKCLLLSDVERKNKNEMYNSDKSDDFNDNLSTDSNINDSVLEDNLSNDSLSNTYNNKNINNNIINQLYKENNILHNETTDYHNLTIDKEIVDKYKYGTAFQYNFSDKLLVINSKFRENIKITQSNDFVINLPYILENVISLQLKSIDNINSVYLINEDKQNNYLIINNTKITIPDGQYNENELISKINNEISNQSITDISLTQLPLTSKISIKHSSPTTTFGLSFEEIDNDEFYNSLGYILGFRKDPMRDGSLNEYISDSIIDVSGPKYFYVCVDDYISNSVCDNIICFGKNDFFQKNIIGRIEMNSDYSQSQFIDNRDRVEKARYYNGTVNINKLGIKLLDEQGNLLQNNNTDYSITLEIKQKINK